MKKVSLAPFGTRGLQPPAGNGSVRLLSQYGDEVVQVGEAGVASVPADVSGVDLLDDHGDFEKTKGVEIEDVRNIVSGLFGVAPGQFLPGQATWQSSRPEGGIL